VATVLVEYLDGPRHHTVGMDEAVVDRFGLTRRSARFFARQASESRAPAPPSPRGEARSSLKPSPNT
jgi:hypothetical protein